MQHPGFPEAQVPDPSSRQRNRFTQGRFPETKQRILLYRRRTAAAG